MSPINASCQTPKNPRNLLLRALHKAGIWELCLQGIFQYTSIDEQDRLTRFWRLLGSPFVLERKPCFFFGQTRKDLKTENPWEPSEKKKRNSTQNLIKVFSLPIFPFCQFCHFVSIFDIQLLLSGFLKRLGHSCWLFAGLFHWNPSNLQQVLCRDAWKISRIAAKSRLTRQTLTQQF